MESLREHFTGVAAKYLSRVDATPRSHQHEIGSNAFTGILGNPGANKVYFNGSFLYVADGLDEPVTASGVLTWYDTRLNNPDRSAEYRLYYRENPVTTCMTEGDFCIVARKPDGTLLLVIAPAGSTSEQQIRWLFGIDTVPSKGYSVREVATNRVLHMAEVSVLEELGIEVRLDDENWLDRILDRFGARFPSTADFSQFARETCPAVQSVEQDPDDALTCWIEHEEMLFRTLERQIVQAQLDQGFTDVDHFIQVSLSVQNRRKSRVGHALEHHLAAVFNAHALPFGRQVVTEHRATADFLFPGRVQYLDQNYPSDRLVMVASKSTCKDRWRQVLTEAQRIPRKHLFTLEPSISPHQTTEMQSHHIQLVVPEAISQTYTAEQRTWLMNLSGLITETRATLGL